MKRFIVYISLLLPVVIMAQSANAIKYQVNFTSVAKHRAIAVLDNGSSVDIDFIKSTIKNGRFTFQGDTIYSNSGNTKVAVGEYGLKKMTLNGSRYVLKKKSRDAMELTDANGIHYAVENSTEGTTRYIAFDNSCSTLPPEVIAWVMYRSAQRTYNAMEFKKAAAVGSSIGLGIGIGTALVK